MRIPKSFLSICLTLILCSSCLSTYKIVKESPAQPDLKGYKTLILGWADLKEDDYEMYGYESKEDWKASIDNLNTTGLQAYFKDLFKNKIAYVVKNKEDKPSFEEGLYIEFPKIGILNNAEYLVVDLKLTDLKTKQVVYSAQSLEIYYRTSGYYGFVSNYSFEGRMNILLYNLLSFVGNKINPKKNS